MRSSLRKICAQCKLVKRGRKNFVICAGNARHKQRQGFATLAFQPGQEHAAATSVPLVQPFSMLALALRAPSSMSTAELLSGSNELLCVSAEDAEDL